VNYCAVCGFKIEEEFKFSKDFKELVNVGMLEKNRR